MQPMSAMRTFWGNLQQGSPPIPEEWSVLWKAKHSMVLSCTRETINTCQQGCCRVDGLVHQKGAFSSSQFLCFV